MVLPRFSLRTLLIGTAVCAVFCFVLASAARQQEWAAAVTIAAGSVALSFLLYALSFAAAMLVASLSSGPRQAEAVRSPFAQHKAAPQILSPDEEE